MKVTKDKIELMKKLRSEGRTQLSIAKELGTSQALIGYYTNEDIRKKRIESSKNYFRNLPIEKRRIRYIKRREYLANYQKTRYTNDPVYKAKLQKRSRDWKNEKAKQMQTL